MEKEKVLEFEIIKTNNFGIIGMLKQNTRILKRNTDTEYSRSYNFPSWDFINKKLYTYGDEKYDNLIFTVPREDIDLFLDKINCINEKYGIPKRWKPKLEESFFIVERVRTEVSFKWVVTDLIYKNDHWIDFYAINSGNCFKTYEEAEKVVLKLEDLEKNFWAKVREGEIGGDE